MLQVQTAPATRPSYLIINLMWLQEGEVKLTPFELPNYTVLREDEKAVFVQPLYWENLCQPDLQGNGVLKGHPASCLSRGQATGPTLSFW